jgi:hypothetical protein
MRQRALIATAFVTVLVLIAAIAVPTRRGSKAPPVASGPVFPTLKDWVSTAARIVVVGPDGTVTLDRREAAKDQPDTKPAEQWTIVEKSGYPAEAATIQQMVNGMMALRYLEAKTRKPDLFPRLEVEEAGKPGAKSRSVEVLDGNGARIAGLIIGKRRYDRSGGNRDGIYIRSPDEAQSWLAEPPITVSSDVLSWLDRKVTDIDPARVKSVSLTGPDGKTLTVSRPAAADKLAVEDLPANAKLKADDPLAAIGAAFRGVDLSDVRPAADLTAAQTESAKVVTFDGLTVELGLADQDGGTWARVSATGTGDAAREADELRTRTKDWAYKLAASKASVLKTRLPDLLEPPAKQS